MADQREAMGQGSFQILPFPLDGMYSTERPGTVKGAPTGAAKPPWTARTVLRKLGKRKRVQWRIEP